jgi:phosphonate transport system permease protein
MSQSNQQQAIKSPPKTRFTAILIVVLALYVYSYIGVKADFGELIDGLPNIGNMLAQLFPPNWAYFSKIMAPMLETVQMAILGTTVGALFSIPFSLLAARNVFPNAWVTGIFRTILNLIRTLPDLLLAGIFVAIFGLGPMAGVVALIFFAFGIITKLLYESIEAIDGGPLEAMTAVGANKLQFIAYAVVPQALPAFVAYVLYTFEVCVRASAILGLVGAGGIGMYLSTALETFHYDQVASILVLTLIIVVLIDTVSATLREKLL